MAIPELIVSIDFSNGPNYGNPFTLDDPTSGRIGFGTFGGDGALVVDVSSQTLSCKITRGRNLIQDQYEPGNSTVRIIDNNGDFNPQNTSSPYYGYLKPLRKIRISSSYNNNTYYLFSGYITDYKYTYPTSQEVGYVDLISVDAFRLFANAAVTTVTGATAGQDTGTRVTKILDQIGWPANMRSIETGDTTCQADPGDSRTALAALRTVEWTEYGAFFMDPEGTAVFYDRNTTTATIGGTPTVFNQTGSGIPYSNIVFAFDDKLVINNANIKRIGGTTQSVSDAVSIDTYFIHSFTKENLLMETDTEALNLSRAYVSSRKNTNIRIDAITLDLNTDNYDAGITAALSLDYFSPVQISNIQPGGSTITQTLQVQGVEHQILARQTWRTTFTTMEPIIDGFIIGDALYGILGTSVLSY